MFVILALTVGVVCLVLGCRSGGRRSCGVHAAREPRCGRSAFAVPFIVLVVACLVAFGVIGRQRRMHREAEVERWAATREREARKTKESVKSWARAIHDKFVPHPPRPATPAPPPVPPEVGERVDDELDRAEVSAEARAEAARLAEDGMVGRQEVKERRQDEKRRGRPNASWDVEGVGLTKKEAVDKALQEGRNRLREYLEASGLPTRWVPSVAYLRSRLVKHIDDVKEGSVEPKLPYYVVKVRVEVNDEDERDIVRRNRLAGVGILLAGAVFLCIAVGGYLRLDEWSKGYYTGWLRFGALTLLAVAGAGLWHWLTV